MIRFWDKVDKSGECWLWTASTCHGGYGSFLVGSRTDGSRRLVKAHRFAYEMERGPIPAGVMLHHLCENPRCVRPDHLEIVSPREHVYRHDGPTAINGRKTHCARCGSALEFLSGGRRCRVCRNEYMREYKRERRSEAYWDDVRKVQRTFAP